MREAGDWASEATAAWAVRLFWASGPTARIGRISAANSADWVWGWMLSERRASDPAMRFREGARECMLVWLGAIFGPTDFCARDLFRLRGG